MVRRRQHLGAIAAASNSAIRDLLHIAMFPAPASVREWHDLAALKF